MILILLIEWLWWTTHLLLQLSQVWRSWLCVWRHSFPFLKQIPSLLRIRGSMRFSDQLLRPWWPSSLLSLGKTPPQHHPLPWCLMLETLEYSYSFTGTHTVTVFLGLPWLLYLFAPCSVCPQEKPWTWTKVVWSMSSSMLSQTSSYSFISSAWKKQVRTRTTIIQQLHHCSTI